MVAITAAMRDYQAPLLLQGMGGMGKSALMSRWVHKAHTKKLDNIIYEHIIFIDCSNGIKTGFLTETDLLEKLDLKYLISDDDPNKLKRIVNRLSQLDNLLLVLDDLPATEPAFTQCYEELGQLSRLSCQVIATSRSELYDDFTLLEINSLSISKCIELFLRHSNPPKDTKSLNSNNLSDNELENVQTIIELAGRHTLVIELLGKLVRVTPYKTSKLLQILQDNEFNIDGNIRYRKDKNTANEDINTALGKLFVLANLDEQQKYILYHIALMDSQVVTAELLIKWLDRLDKERDFNELALSSWLQVTTSNDASENSDIRYYSMHQVITHAVCSQFYADYQEDKGRFEFVIPVIENMESYYRQYDAHYIDKEANPVQSKKEQINPTYLPAIAGYMGSSICLVSDSNLLVPLVKSLNRFIYFLDYQDHYLPDITTLSNAIEYIKKSLGENHPDYATSVNNLAGLYESMGEYVQALPLYKQALAVIKQSFEESQSKIEQSFVENYSNYAATLNNLAGLYESQGEYEKALPLYIQALTIVKQILGEKHPYYATCLNNLASLYKITGKYDQALSLFKQALGIRKQSLGEHHPDYAASLNNLAGLYVSTDKYEQALPLYEQALAIRKQRLGEYHPDYATSLNNLAGLYGSTGDYEKALPLYEQSIAIKKQSLGEHHPDYAISLDNLAQLYAITDKYELALPLYNQSLAILKKSLGENHPDYAHSLNNLAQLYQSTGKYNQSISLYEKVLAITRQSLGEHHPSYAIYLYNFAGLYERTSDYKKSLQMYAQALKIFEQVLGVSHTKTQTARSNYISVLNRYLRDCRR